MKRGLLIVTLMAAVSFGQTITPIADIQDTTGTGDASVLLDSTVTISGIVTAEFWGSESNRYMFVQDANGPWNGIMLFEYGGWDSFGFDSAGTGTLVYSVAEGDSVTVTGTVDEYYGMTELGDVTEFIVHGPATTIIEPDAVTSVEASNLEHYEGCLVEVVDATVYNPDDGFGEWTATDATAGEIKMDDRWDYFYTPTADQELAKIVGCIEYSFGEYKIQPRLARDVVEAGNVRLQRIQQVLYSDLLKAGFDTQSDTSYMVGDTVTIVGVVTMPTGLSYAGDGVKFIFQDTSGGPWSSILSYDPDSSAFPVLYEGDVFEVTGYISEYATGPSNMTELFVTETPNIIDYGYPLPEPPVVNTGDLRWPTTAEQWGTVMVRVENAVVVANDLPYGEWAIDDGTGSVNVDDDSDSINVWQTEVGRPPNGTNILSIEGWIYHHYGSYVDSTAYKLEPLYVEDIVIGASPPNITDAMREPCTVGPNDAVDVTAWIESDTTIVSAQVLYIVDGGTDTAAVDMSNTDSTAWMGTIPATATEGAFVEYIIQATNDPAMDFWSTLPSNPDNGVFGYWTTSDPLTISDIQYSPWANGDSPYYGCEVTLNGVVTGDTMQVGAYGAYTMQDGFGAWNGIMFNDTDTGVELTRGDSVSVTGYVEEYDPDWHFKWDNNTKLVDVSDITVHSSGNTVTPMSLSTADLAQDAEEVESYEGVLVTVSNVTVSSLNSYDWSVQDASGIECLIDDDLATSDAMAELTAIEEGDEFASITGIFNFSFGTYKIQVRDINDLEYLGVNEDFEPQPFTYALHQNYPNPFNPETRIRFDLKAGQQVKLVIYDILGRQIRTLVSSKFDAGMHIVNWDGLNNDGKAVGSGVYIYRIKAGDFVDHKKMLLVR